MSDIKKILKENFDNLPKDIQGVVLSGSFNTNLDYITEKNRLSPEQEVALHNETVLVLLGITHPSNFVKNLEENIGLQKRLSEDIKREVDAAIFTPIKKSLESIYTTKAKEPEPIPKPTAPRPPSATITPPIPSTIKPEPSIIKPVPTPPKLIIKEEGSKPTPRPEHMFESKLKESLKPETKREAHTPKEVDFSPEKTVIKKPDIPGMPPQQQKVDPYREMPK